MLNWLASSTYSVPLPLIPANLPVSLASVIDEGVTVPVRDAARPANGDGDSLACAAAQLIGDGPGWALQSYYSPTYVGIRANLVIS